MANRSKVISGIVAVAAVLAIGAWAVGSRIESPADAAARTAPPTPSAILVPVESRVLSSNIVTRGKARFGLPQPISIAPSTLKPSPGLIASLPLRNKQLEEGAVMFTASGRPVFVLQGKIPAYRDLTPGISGDDVRQLEQGLKRLGFDPGRVDGTYDKQTSAAVAKWYKAKGWEPFGPTREQLANLATLEKDWGEASKSKLAAATPASALPVDSARATAEQANSTAAAELATKKADLQKLRAASGKIPLAVEAERAKAEYANKAAAAEIAALIAERALIVLDPRQPETARTAIHAKLEVAQAAASKTKLEGELAILAAERESQLAAERVTLAEGSVKTARLEGQKTVQTALDTRQVAALEARLAAGRTSRLGADLAQANRKIGVQIPVDEIVFIPELPVRVEEITAVIGAAAAGPVLSVTNNQLAIDSALPLETAPLIKPGMTVTINEQALGIKAKGVVEAVASTPGTRGVDGYHVYFETRVTETSGKLEGVSLRLTIPIKSSKGAVTAVPISALSLAADGTSRVQVQNKGVLEYIVVTPGLVADGYVEVTPVHGTLAPGRLVVVGYKTPDTPKPEAKTPP